MMHSLSFQNQISPDDVWEKLNLYYRQLTIELFAKLAIKLLNQEVADLRKKEDYYA